MNWNPHPVLLCMVFLACFAMTSFIYVGVQLSLFSSPQGYSETCPMQPHCWSDEKLAWVARLRENALVRQRICIDDVTHRVL